MYTFTGSNSLNDLILKYKGKDGLISIDLGSGYYKPQGFIGIDNLSGAPTQIKNDANAPDILMNLNFDPLPFADASCREVRSSHFLEHSNLDHIHQESHRVLVPGGIFNATVPYANSAEGMYPGHTIFLTEKWFKNNMIFQDLFEIFDISFKKSEEYKALPMIVKLMFPFNIARKMLFNACNEMTIRARCKKAG
jgi:predicted SAM-dependent methyltransferase